MNYSDLRQSEQKEFAKTLKPSQRAKLRKLEVNQDQTLHLVNCARATREDEVRMSAYVSLRIPERIRDLVAEKEIKIYALQLMATQLHKEIAQANEELREDKYRLNGEAYAMAANDEEVSRLHSIWKQTNDSNKLELDNLVNSFNEKVEA